MSSSDTSPWTRTRRPLAGLRRVVPAPRRAGRARLFSAIRRFAAPPVLLSAPKFAALRKIFFVMGLGSLVAGCFQPMYAEHPLPGAAGSASIVGAMRAVDVAAIDAPAGDRKSVV